MGLGLVSAVTRAGIRSHQTAHGLPVGRSRRYTIRISNPCPVNPGLFRLIQGDALRSGLLLGFGFLGA